MKGRMVGREKELDHLNAFVRPMMQKEVTIDLQVL